MKFKLTEASVDDYINDRINNPQADNFDEFDKVDKELATPSIDAQTDVVVVDDKPKFQKPNKGKRGKMKVISDPNGDIERELSDKLDVAIEAYEMGTKTWKNVLLVGPPGCGKTSRIKNWAAAHGVNVVTKLCSVMDEVDINGIPAAVKAGAVVASEPDENGKVQVAKPLDSDDVFKRLGATDFDELDNAPEGTIGSILFLDEFNRGLHNVRGALLNLIQDHEIPAGKHMRDLNDFLFTVAAINPEDEGENGIDDPLNDAEISRFASVNVAHDPRNTKFYLDNLLDYMIETNAESNHSADVKDKRDTKYRRQKKLADTILSHRDFHFDTPEEIEDNKATDEKSIKAGANGKVLTARTFENALLGSDGTVNSFHDEWMKTANGTKWQTMIYPILRGYSDKVDKANSVFSNPRPDVARKQAMAAQQPAQASAPAPQPATQQPAQNSAPQQVAAPVSAPEPEVQPNANIEPQVPEQPQRKERKKFTGGFDDLDLG